MTRKSRLISTVALLLASTLSTTSHAAPDEAQRIRQVVADPVGPAAPGCAVGVFRNGKVSEIVTSGAADIAAGRAIGPDTQFYAASVSKQFTALAIMQLVVADKIRLDEDVRRVLPETAGMGQHITIGMLVNHTAGVRDDLILLSLDGRLDLSQATRAQALRAVFRQKGVQFTPGTRYDYSNGNYLLLSEIVERVSGQPFELYMRDHILAPLGMTRSFLLSGARSADPDLAHGYEWSDNHFQLRDDHTLYSGSGGLVTTISDLARYDHDIDTGHKVWTSQIRALMLAPTYLNDGRLVRSAPNAYYAGGLRVSPSWFLHYGGVAGFTNLYARLPQQRLGIAMLCNRGDLPESGYQERLNRVVAAVEPDLPLPAEPNPTAAVLSGRYAAAEVDALYDVVGDGDQLTIEIRSGEDPATAPLGKLTFRRRPDDSYANPEATLIPDKSAQGFTLTALQLTVHFDRIVK